MKYRIIQYPDGYEYESFLDDKVPAKYKDIVVDKLPQEIIDAEITMQQEAQEKADYLAAMPDLVKSLKTRIATLEAKEITP